MNMEITEKNDNETNVTNKDGNEVEKRKRVILALPGDSFTSSFVVSILATTNALIDSNKYQLIAGERRFRAAEIAGLKDVPVYIRQANDQQLLELALLENLQRENLNAVEIALSYKRMMDELN